MARRATSRSKFRSSSLRLASRKGETMPRPISLSVRPLLFATLIVTSVSLSPRAGELFQPEPKAIEKPDASTATAPEKQDKAKPTAADADEPKDDSPKPDQKREVLSGKVVFLLGAL